MPVLGAGWQELHNPSWERRGQLTARAEGKAPQLPAACPNRAMRGTAWVHQGCTTASSPGRCWPLFPDRATTLLGFLKHIEPGWCSSTSAQNPSLE